MSQNREQHITNHCNKFANRLKRLIGEKHKMDCRIDVYYFPLYDTWVIAHDIQDEIYCENHQFIMQLHERYIGKLKGSIYECHVSNLHEILSDIAYLKQNNKIMF